MSAAVSIGLRCRYRVKLRGAARAGVMVSVYVVVAESRDEACLQALALEPPILRPIMKMIECDPIDPARDAQKGVESILARFAVPNECPEG